MVTFMCRITMEVIVPGHSYLVLVNSKNQSSAGSDSSRPLTNANGHPILYSYTAVPKEPPCIDKICLASRGSSSGIPQNEFAP